MRRATHSTAPALQRTRLVKQEIRRLQQERSTARQAAEDMRSPCAASGGRAPSAEALLNPRTLRCVRFLTKQVTSVDMDSEQASALVPQQLVQAAVLNLQLEHGLQVTREQVAEWVGLGL